MKKITDPAKLPLIAGRCPMCMRLPGTPDARIENGVLMEYCSHFCHTSVDKDEILKALPVRKEGE